MKRNVTFRVLPGVTSPGDGGVGVLKVEPFSSDPQPPNHDFVGASAIRLGGEGKLVALDPGRYVASVRVPDGRVYSRAFELGEVDGLEVRFGEVGARVRLLSGSPLMRQRRLHNDPWNLHQRVLFQASTKSFGRAVRQSNLTKPRHAKKVEPEVRLIHFEAKPDITGVRAALRRASLEPRTRSLLPHGWSREEVLAILGTPLGEAKARTMESSPQRRSMAIIAPVDQGSPRMRYALLLANGRQSLVGRLPGSWRCVSTGARAEVGVFAKRQDDERYKFDVRVSDPDVQSVLSFVLQSDLEGALAVLDACMDMLASKTKNPYAAAAAGYVLLNAPADRSSFPWQHWIGNLGHNFPDIPDGLILHATLLLQTKPGRMLPTSFFPEDVASRANMAASLLLEALERGLPLYRAGVRLLASNLRILISDDCAKAVTPEALRKAYELTAWLLMRLDPQQVFTVVDVTGI